MENRYEKIKETLKNQTKDFTQDEWIDYTVKQYQNYENTYTEISEKNKVYEDNLQKTRNMYNELASKTDVTEMQAQIEQLKKENAQLSEGKQQVEQELEKAYEQNKNQQKIIVEKNEKIIELQDRNKQLNQENIALMDGKSKNITTQGEKELKEAIENSLERDFQRRVEERYARMKKNRKAKVRTELKEKYFTRHMENFNVHRKAVNNFVRQDIGEGIKNNLEESVGKVVNNTKEKVGNWAYPKAVELELILQKRKSDIQVRKKGSQIRRDKRKRAVNEFFGKLEDRKKTAQGYIGRFVINASVIKPNNIAEGYKRKMENLRTSFQQRIREEKVQLQQSKTANKSRTQSI